MRKLFLSLIALLTAATVAAQESDKLLGVMKSELTYDFEQLQKQTTKPYFMSLRVEDNHSMGVSSSFGTLSKTTDNHKRTLVPQVRVGSYELDNFKYQSQGQDQMKAREVPLSLNDDAEQAIRQSIWGAVTKRYDFACSTYEAAKAKKQTSTENEDKAPCFSKAPVENYYEPTVSDATNSLDKALWTKRMNEVSAVFKQYKGLLSGSATLSYDVIRTYFVNTDGTSIVKNRVAARIMLSVSTMADDGMNLPLYKDYFSYSPDSLPNVETMKADAKDLAERVLALKAAPVVDPYTGPAIMSGEASGVFFHEIFGHRLEGHRLKQGGETFKSKVGELILPKSFNVYCDPTLRHYAGTDLNGYYLYDDEGVKSRRVDNVVGGVLKSFLVNRVPLDGFPESNGHGRCDGTCDPVARQSNLIVETTQPKTDAELRQMLKAEAKKQGKEYGYYFRSVSSGYTLTGEGGSLNSFNVTPLEVYRVYVDGRADELVRGVDMIGTPLSMFSNIQAAGGETKTFTGSCGAESGWVPVTASSPAIFVSKIETQRRQKTQTKPTLLPAPELKAGDKTFANEDDEIFAAMSDELNRNMEGLNTDGAQKPYYINYIVNKNRSDIVGASLGGVFQKSNSPWRLSGQMMVNTGDYQHSSEFQYGAMAQAPLCETTDYDAIRRNLWLGTDQMYNYAVMLDAQKKAVLAQNPMSGEWANVPDMQKLPATEYIETATSQPAFDTAKAEELAKKLSTVFKAYNYLTSSSVSISHDENVIYKLTSEGTRMKFFSNGVCLYVKAGARAVAGTNISDMFTINATSFDELPSYEALEAKTKELAEKMLLEVNAPQNKEFYSGPVMIEGDGLAQTFSQALFAQGKLVAYKPMIGMQIPETMEDKIGVQVLDKRLTVTDNPQQADFNGEKALGHYDIDFDGVRPQQRTLIENGVMKSALNGRYPTLHSPVSTGSTRIAAGSDIKPIVAPGVVTISTSKGTAPEKMKKELIKAARSKGLEYGFLVRFFDGGNAFQAYKVNVKDGSEQMTMIDSFGLRNENQLKNLGAISTQQQLSNIEVQGANVSVIHPTAIIINDMEIPRCNSLTTKAPAIPNPAIR